MPEIVLGPSTVPTDVDLEGWDLDGLDLNDGVSFSLESVEFLPARKRTQWADNPDANGSEPVGETRYENAEWTGRIRVEPQATVEAGLAKLALLTDKLQACFGKPLTWHPATTSASVAKTWYALEAEYEEIPYTVESGYFAGSPAVSVRITCRPFGHGTQVTSTETTFATPLGTHEILSVGGDVAAEATLIATDNATAARKHVEWGLEHTHYNSASPFDLLLDEGDLSVSATQATAVADADAYSGNAFELKPLFSGWQDLCKADDLPHRGSFRIKGRAKNTADEETVSLRLLWRVGNTPYTDNASVVVPAFSTASYAEADLGTLSVPAGSANLDLIVQAKADSVTTSPEGVRFDYLEFIPTERYGVGAGESVVLGGAALVMADEFAHDYGVNLTGTNPDLGAAWVGAGDADDFVLYSGVTFRPAPVADADLNTGRYAAAGPSLTNTRASCGLDLYGPTSGSNKESRAGLLLRYSDASNWIGVFVRLKRSASGKPIRRLAVFKRVLGTVTKITEVEIDNTSLYRGDNYVEGTITASVSGAGLIAVVTGSTRDAEGTDTVISITDGALPASGKVGIYQARDFSDTNTSSFSDSYFYNITAYSGLGSTTETYAIPSAGRVEFGPRQATTYTAATGGDPAPFIPRGSRFELPTGNSRIALKARRNDVGNGGVDANLTDSTKLKVVYTPRYLLPR